MNTSEGQTQEPVGGKDQFNTAILLLKDSLIEQTGKIDSLKEKAKYAKNNRQKVMFEAALSNIQSWIAEFNRAIEVLENYSTPPPQPLGIDVDKDARGILFNSLNTVFRERWKNHFTNDECQFRINKLLDEFLAGYAASPQSSTSGEEIEIIDGYTQLMIDRRSLPKDGQHVKFMTENEEFHEGYFVGGDDIFHVSDSKFFFKWHVQQWKAI